MDKKITSFITTELKIGKWRLAPIDILLLVFAPVFAGMIRSSVVSYTASELYDYVQLVSWLKIVTAVFDFLLGMLAGIYVYRQTGSRTRGYLAYALILMLPVLCAGSAMWGMGDSVYVFFAVLALFLQEEGKGNTALLCYGISLFLNRYAFFLLPLFAIAFMQKKNRLWAFFFPLCGAGLRNVLAGGAGKSAFPIFEAERLFLEGRGETLLSYHWANIFQIIGPDKFIAEYGIVAKCMAVVLMLVVTVSYVKAAEDGKAPIGERPQWGTMLGRGNLVPTAVFLCMLFPYIMPQMDERCALLADVLLIVMVMKHVQLYYLAILQVTISYMAYSFYFRGDCVVPFAYAALAELALLLLAGLFAVTGRSVSLRADKQTDR